MMKILMLTDNLMKGGKERRLLEILRHFEKDSAILVELVILKDLIQYPEVYELKRTKLTVLKRRIKKDPKIFADLYTLCKTSKPDLIHTWGSMPSVYIFGIAYLLRIPLLNGIIVNAKCATFSEDWIRSRITFPFSRAILANSKAGLAAYKVKSKKGNVIYNGFNFDRLSLLEPTEAVKNQYNINTKYVIGMVAAFHPRKDYKTFLETANSITRDRNDISFIAVGDGELLDEFQHSYASNPLIVFTNRVDSVENLIQIFDIGVLLTNPDKHLEGISNVILEMMALQIPVIASSGGGTNEIVVNNKSGILISPHSSEEFRDAIFKLITSESLRSEFGKYAVSRVKETFSIEQMTTKLQQLYTKMINDN